MKKNPSKCPICGQEFSDFQPRCSYCGRKIRRCPEGHEIPAYSQYCPYDGTKLSSLFAMDDLRFSLSNPIDIFDGKPILCLWDLFSWDAVTGTLYISKPYQTANIGISGKLLCIGSPGDFIIGIYDSVAKKFDSLYSSLLDPQSLPMDAELVSDVREDVYIPPMFIKQIGKWVYASDEQINLWNESGSLDIKCSIPDSAETIVANDGFAIVNEEEAIIVNLKSGTIRGRNLAGKFKLLGFAENYTQYCVFQNVADNKVTIAEFAKSGTGMVTCSTVKDASVGAVSPNGRVVVLKSKGQLVLLDASGIRETEFVLGSIEGFVGELVIGKYGNDSIRILDLGKNRELATIPIQFSHSLNNGLAMAFCEKQNSTWRIL